MPAPLPQYEKFSANRRNYLKIFFTKEVSNTEIALAVRAIAHHEWINENEYIIVYTNPRNDWYGWGVRTMKPITPVFRFWREAVNYLRELENKIVDLQKQSA